MTLVEILMNRDEVSRAEAKEMIEECKQALLSGDDYAIEDYLGLEDDYIFEVLDN